MMRAIFTILLSFLMLSAFGQVEKDKFLTTGMLRVRNYYEGGSPYKKFEIGVTNKTGYFLTSTFAAGLQIDYTWTRQKVKRYSTIQQEGSRWYEKGLYNKHEYALGLFADKYFRLGEKLYTTVGVYGQYYNLSEIERGEIYNVDDVSAGILYKSYTYPDQVAQIGITNTLVYFLNDRFGINCKVTAFDLVINRYSKSEFDLRFPVMSFGIQYHFQK